MLFSPFLPLEGKAIFGQNCCRGSMWLFLRCGNQKIATGPSFFQPPRFSGVLPSNEPVDINKYLLHDGDIVISRAGSVGFSHLIKNPKPAIFASYLIRFRPLI